VEDLLLAFRMPKLDALPDGGAFVAAFAVRLLEGNEPRLRAIPVALAIGPTSLVTVRQHAVPEVEARIDAALAGRVDGPIGGPQLAHAVLDVLIDRHLPVMLRVAEVAEDLEERLDPRADRESLIALDRLIVLRRDVLAFRRLGVAQHEILRRLERLLPTMRQQLADVADNQREATDTAAATGDYIDGAIESYRLRRDARMENGIRRLTVLAGILGPLTLLIGLWGVNFPNIPGTGTAYGWPVFVAVLAILILLGAWYFRRRGLL
jgi:magnesium transporter